ncbi:MAG: AAA family ATPase [Chloroflexi bacterium]|nr:AAA family ATPase [Chloroflexota bacterium]
MPRFILENHANHQLSGHFEAVSLFVDISGFSSVTNTLKQFGNEAAEAMSDVMDAIFEPLVTAVYEQGGFITTFAGDAFTALFPIPKIGDKGLAYLQALAAASEIQSYIRTNPTQKTPYGAFAFTVKSGIASGSVQWGILSPDEGNSDIKSAYFFNGTAVEDAAGAEHYAQAGNMILTGPVYEILSDVVQVIAVGDEGHQRVLSVTGRLPDPQPVADMEMPRQDKFVPEAILQRKTRGEFRQVISVFVNLMGIDTVQQLDSFVQSVFDLQQKYGGFLARVDFGDKGCNLLMFWGMPTSHENDIVRALNFLLDLPTITPGTYKAGVTYQTLFAGETGSAYRGEYTAYGGGVSLAARLMVKAPWGEIWLDEQLTQRARRYFEIQPVGEYELKGFKDPQPLYRLIEPREQRLEVFFQGEMVGREEELQQLLDFVQPILLPTDTDQERFAGICVVSGEAGLGKSRLIHEFRQRLDASVAQQGIVIEWRMGQTNQIVQQPLSPFRYGLRQYFEQSPAASDAVNKRNFGRKMDEAVALSPPEFARELNRLRSFIGSLLDLYWENSLYSEVDPEARHEMVFTALKTLMQAGSLYRPTIVVTEDIHWMDAETRAFAQRMLRNMNGFPIAIIATARLDELPEPIQFPPNIPFHIVHLQDLPDVAVERLAESVLGNKISASLLELVMQRSEGNPFFAEQILLYLRGQGDITFKDGMWHLASSPQHSSPLPGDLRAIFIARLDQLTLEVKDVVQAASVLGREFEVHVLTAMLEDDTNLSEKISAAEHETVWTALNQMRYLFKHALLRDAAYSMQLRARRRVLHQSAAETLENLFPSEIPAHYQELAYHYEAAYQHGIHELGVKALDYLEKTAQAAADSYQHEIAIEYFTRALEISHALDDRKRYTLLMERTEAYHNFNQWDQEAADLDELMLIADASQIPAQQAEVRLRQLRHAVATANRDKVPALADTVIQLAQSAQEVAIEANAHLLLAQYYSQPFNLPFYEQHTGKAHALARVAQARDLEADALCNMSIIQLHHHPDEKEALDYLRQALAIYQETGNRRKQVETLIRIAGLVDTAEQEAYWHQALELAQEIGYRQGEATVFKRLASYEGRQNNYAEIWNFFDKSLRIYQEISDYSGIMETCITLAFYHCHFGDFSEAKRNLDEAFELARRLGKFGRLHGALTNYYFEVGDFEKAIQSARETLEINESAQSSLLIFAALADLVHKLTLAGQLDEAGVYYERLRSIESHLDTGADTVGADLALTGQMYVLDYLIACNEIEPALESANRIWETLQLPEWRDLYRSFSMDTDVFYKVCQVWNAVGDTRAEQLLEQLYDDLHYIADFIPDENKRRMYLENPYYHRQIIRSYQRLKGISPEPEIAEEVTEVPPSDNFGVSSVLPEIMPDSIEDDTGETINIRAGNETPVIIHIEADERPTVKTSVMRENVLEVVDEPNGEQMRPVIHVQIIIENHGTIHNFNIYNGERD